MELVIGDRAWSSWSLRPWLALKRTGAPFTERLVRLRRTDTAEALARAGAPAGRAPFLRTDEGLVVWDSLAICEWAAERFPAAQLWPADAHARAVARSASAEMHAGFPALRSEMPMQLGVVTPQAPSPACAADLSRLVRLWGDARDRFGAGGPFLFGAWSIADAMFTPVATRLRTYAVDLAEHADEGAGSAYVRTLLSQPEFLEWEAAA